MKKVTLFFFSGSGNTRYLAELLKNNIPDNFDVEIKEVDKITRSIDSFNDDFDMAGFIYPVHALNAPSIFYDFIKNYLTNGNGRSAFVVRSPGDPFFNGGSCKEVTKSVQKKGYEVFHESMIVMPANIFLRYKDPFIKEILDAAKKRVEAVCREIASLTPGKQNASFLLKFMTFIASRIESFGAPLFGKDLKVKNSCTKCGKCAKKCPTQNISMTPEKPRFGWKCIICMRCIYGCPVNAINPFAFSFFKLKKWYNLKNIENENISNADTEYRNRRFYRMFEKYLKDSE